MLHPVVHFARRLRRRRMREQLWHLRCRPLLPSGLLCLEARERRFCDLCHALLLGRVPMRGHVVGGVWRQDQDGLLLLVRFELSHASPKQPPVKSVQKAIAQGQGAPALCASHGATNSRERFRDPPPPARWAQVALCPPDRMGTSTRPARSQPRRAPPRSVSQAWRPATAAGARDKPIRCRWALPLACNKISRPSPVGRPSRPRNDLPGGRTHP